MVGDNRARSFRFQRVLAPLVLFALVLIAGPSTAANVTGRVVDVDAERGEARLAVPDSDGIDRGARGEILGRGGPVEFSVQSTSGNSVVVRDSNRDGFANVQPGDTAVLFPSPSRLLEDSQSRIEAIDRLLAAPQEQPVLTLEQAPDLLADVTGEVLEDYEAWLHQLEGESAVIPSTTKTEAAELGRSEIPVYPNYEVFQELRSGVDYDRTVTDSTAENRIGRFASWEYEVLGELWEGIEYRANNLLEQNESYLIDEFDFRFDREFGNGDRFWWRNRAALKVFRNDEGDSYVYDDLEARYVRKISENWEWQRGVEIETRQEYEASPNRGFSRFRGILEWNYQKDYETFFDLSYELTQEIRSADEDAEQEYLEHLVDARYSTVLGKWDLYGTIRSEYRDYAQPEDQSDYWVTEGYGSARYKLTDEWSTGVQARTDVRKYFFTEDFDSDSLFGELAPFLDYWGEEFSLSFSPRIGGRHYLGEVPDDVILLSDSPRDKSDGDWFEAGFYASLSWYPNERWRVTVSEDIAHRWFPNGETGEFVSYLDALLIADSTTNLVSIFVSYEPRENLEFSASATHNIEIHPTYDENDFSNLHLGLEVIYRY